ncbi:MAG: DUF63 family protein [Methanosarcinales archaeon]
MQTLHMIRDFIYKYYIDPIIQDSGYNPVNTITWAIILGLSLFWVLKLLNKLKVTINEKFIIAVSPWIFIGSILRVFEDSGFFSPPLQYLFITPQLYFIDFILTTFVLVVSIKLQKRDWIKDYNLLFGLTGLMLCFALLILLLFSDNIMQSWVPVAVLGLATLIAIIIYTIAVSGNIEFLYNKLNIFILWVHLFDASSTFIGMDFLEYSEKHVVPTFLINLTGTAIVMYPLKIAIFIPVLYLLDKYFSEEELDLKNLIKLVIIVLGLAPAVRNTLRMTFGV